MQTAIVKAETKEQYYFFDDPVWDEDIRKDERSEEHTSELQSQR